MVNRAKFSLVAVPFLLAAVGAVGVCARPQEGGRANRAALRKKLREVNRSFTYGGKFINPLAIRDLLLWASDTLPGPVAVDVEGTYGSDRYFGDYTVEGGRVIAAPRAGGDAREYFGYEHLGVLANGFHVLRTYESGGGTGVFQSLLLLKCVIDYEYDGEGRRRDRLVLLRMGELVLGDRYPGEVRLWPAKNVVEVGPDERNRRKGFTVELR